MLPPMFTWAAGRIEETGYETTRSINTHRGNDDPGSRL
jgi:hypothetical protein